MKPKPIVLIGGGGHSKSCIDVIESTGEYTIVGILDKKEKLGQLVLDYEINGTEDDLPGLIAQDNSFCLTIGQIKYSEIRQAIFRRLLDLGADIPTIISPKAAVSKYAKVGKGTVVLHSAIINAGAVVGDNCIINTGALIEHDVQIHNHVHVATRATVNGECVVGEGAFIGSGTVLIQQVVVGKNVVVGAGSVVIHQLAEGVYAGNPAQKIG